MEIQAIWEKGVFRPIAPLKLNRRIVTIKVCDENDAAITTQEKLGTQAAGHGSSHDVSAKTQALLERLAKIHESILALPEDRLAPVTAKQMEKLAAIEMREDR